MGGRVRPCVCFRFMTQELGCLMVKQSQAYMLFISSHDKILFPLHKCRDSAPCPWISFFLTVCLTLVILLALLSRIYHWRIRPPSPIETTCIATSVRQSEASGHKDSLITKLSTLHVSKQGVLCAYVP
ncbi:hypothetical protein CPSG_03656 [Coccidioides posadasii str. Silveira]|uniref:Uncharacterized protein n=1 Tax=Coccidioides posadasii (strain RMSCC 757 / Silveira) TaxID=443226 RepID=E9D258_COCPS|nr:hypothetical protein CPSG_03656 [Coccidioides posadasii str. Silveira]